MAYILGDRHQISMLPSTIEEYIGEDDPVRAYDAFIDALDFNELGFVNKQYQVGNPSYHPKTMLKILVYGYSYAWRSSRKIERALHHNLSFIWLAGGLKPDHKTISKFRKDNAVILKKVLKQYARICIDLGLIEGNSLFTDGSKVRANASINQTKSKERWEEILNGVDERIDQILLECDQSDQQEEGSLVKLEKDLQDNQKLRKKVKDLINRMDQEGLKKINGTDPDCINFKGRQGSHAGYNVQSVTDEKNGLIINTDVVAESNDLNQFSEQIEQANEVLGKQCEKACADAGYFNASNLKKSLKKGIDVVVPSPKQMNRERRKDNPFDKDKFQYDAANNRYICPQGHILRYVTYSAAKGYFIYRSKPSNCKKCDHFGVCTKNKRGREIDRLVDEDIKEQVEARYDTEDGKSIYKKRKEKVELPFGHIKRTLNGGAFLVKSIKSAQGEMAIFANCFNIARMITLLGGVGPMVAKMRQMAT